METYKQKMIRFIVVLISVMGSGLSLAQRSLMAIHSWAYQLQNIDITQIANNSTFELIVMDYSADGSDDGKFTKEDILQIKNSGKKAICYISIGEAEDYRFYWDPNWDSDGNGIPDQGAPAWLGQENPDWEGNYKVRFWQTDWQEIYFTSSLKTGRRSQRPLHMPGASDRGGGSHELHRERSAFPRGPFLLFVIAEPDLSFG